mgnify:CR=1 FL=1
MDIKEYYKNLGYMGVDVNSGLNYKRLQKIIKHRPKIICSYDDFKLLKLNKHNLAITLDGFGIIQNYYITKYL